MKIYRPGFRMAKEKPTMAANALGMLSLIIVLAAGIYLALLLVELRKVNIRKLQEQGRRVIAIVTKVEQEQEERGNPEVPRIDYVYYIEAEWTDPHTGNTYQFRSNRLTSSPKEYTPGTFVHVLIDPKNPARYALELPEYDVYS
jgi:Protein of unknown function (DUF3592)